MGKPEYLQWIDHELAGSKQKIEAELKHPLTALAYPYGGYSELVVERARAAGYQAAFTCDDGDVDQMAGPLLLNRRLVFRQTTPKAYVKYFADKPLHMADLSPKDGERVKEVPKEIRARILDFDKIQLDTAQILVDKVGRHWQPVSIDPKTGWLRFPIPTGLRTGYYFVSLVAKDRLDPALQRETSWLFIVRRNASRK